MIRSSERWPNGLCGPGGRQDMALCRGGDRDVEGWFGQGGVDGSSSGDLSGQSQIGDGETVN